jgi:predicted KAP-like P-loop ATPase
VFSLNGPWGAGKSSVLALAIAEMRELERDVPENSRAVLVSFNPWQLGGRDDLYRAFFRKLSEQFEASNMQKAAEATKNLGRRTLKGVASIPSLALALWGLDLDKIAEKGGKTLEAFVGQTEAKKSLDNLRNDLVETLRQAQRRVIVIIDDLDRLVPDEIREIIALVKSLGDFPYVVYVLSFDEVVVRRSLEFVGESAGEANNSSYLEKLVQAPFDMPTADREGLDTPLSRKSVA